MPCNTYGFPTPDASPSAGVAPSTVSDGVRGICTCIYMISKELPLACGVPKKGISGIVSGPTGEMSHGVVLVL
jgi:hypothetical protein